MKHTLITILALLTLGIFGCTKPPIEQPTNTVSNVTTKPTPPDTITHTLQFILNNPSDTQYHPFLNILIKVYNGPNFNGVSNDPKEPAFIGFNAIYIVKFEYEIDGWITNTSQYIAFTAYVDGKPYKVSNSTGVAGDNDSYCPFIYTN